MSTQTLALMHAQPLPDTTGGAPDWIHLLPAGGDVMTMDGRGPYRVVDPQSIVAASAGQKLPVDENHAIDWAAPRGEPSPARGYIVELQARADGIWGRVDWTQAGRALMADRAYLGISPAIVHDGQKRVLGIARASLTNKPNLRGLTTLHMETRMSAAIAKALGLSDDAAEDAVLAAIDTLKKPVTALQSSLGEIGVALGVAQDAQPEAILAAARARTAALPAELVALQTELAGVATELKTLKDRTAREKAEAAVDTAIREGRPGVKVSRDRFIAMHMADPAGTDAIIAGIPPVTGPIRAADPATTTVALQSDSRDLVGRARAYQASQKAAGHDIGWSDAVIAVSEGKQ